MNDAIQPSLDSWTSLLSISSRFDMGHIRERAIKEIANFQPGIDPVEQAVLAVKFSVHSWLPIAYAALCQRQDPIEVEEARKLGVDTMALLAKARERVRDEERESNEKRAPVLSVSCGWCGRNGSCSCIGKSKKKRVALPKESSELMLADADDAEPLVNRIIREVFWPTPPPLNEDIHIDVSFLYNVKPTIFLALLAYTNIYI